MNHFSPYNVMDTYSGIYRNLLTLSLSTPPTTSLIAATAITSAIIADLAHLPPKQPNNRPQRFNLAAEGLLSAEISRSVAPCTRSRLPQQPAPAVVSLYASLVPKLREPTPESVAQAIEALSQQPAAAGAAGAGVNAVLAVVEKTMKTAQASRKEVAELDLLVKDENGIIISRNFPQFRVISQLICDGLTSLRKSNIDAKTCSSNIVSLTNDNKTSIPAVTTLPPLISASRFQLTRFTPTPAPAPSLVPAESVAALEIAKTYHQISEYTQNEISRRLRAELTTIINIISLFGSELNDNLSRTAICATGGAAYAAAAAAAFNSASSGPINFTVSQLNLDRLVVAGAEVEVPIAFWGSVTAQIGKLDEFLIQSSLLSPEFTPAATHIVRLAGALITTRQLLLDWQKPTLHDRKRGKQRVDTLIQRGEVTNQFESDDFDNSGSIDDHPEFSVKLAGAARVRALAPILILQETLSATLNDLISRVVAGAGLADSLAAVAACVSGATPGARQAVWTLISACARVGMELNRKEGTPQNKSRQILLADGARRRALEGVVGALEGAQGRLHASVHTAAGALIQQLVMCKTECL